MKWINLAAEQGHAEAQVNLARLYENGRVEPDQSDSMGKLLYSAIMPSNIYAEVS